MGAGLVQALTVVGASLTAALLALCLLHVLSERRAVRQARAVAAVPRPAEDAVFLFDDETLVEASDAARALLSALPSAPSAWAQFTGWAAPRFPGLMAEIDLLPARGQLRFQSDGPVPLVLTGEWREGLARIALYDPTAEGGTVPVDRLSLGAAEEELGQLRRAMETAPLPVWRECAAGSVVWANPAYLRLAGSREGDSGVVAWPLPRLFPTPPLQPRDAADAPPPPGTAGRGPRPTTAISPLAEPVVPERAELIDAPVAGPRWFDCLAFAEPDGGRLCYALPADAAARAEGALHDLVQTLSRTFAHLPVGLAVFDRLRRLQLFNPALSELTTLPPAFLVGRPGFEEFFDALRARQMIPEPKDYRAWRRGLVEMERAAEQGQYQEIWTLTHGQTYRVTGRPHPDGAVAFLIENVSAEVSLTRRFRSEIEAGQAALDSLDEALAVFCADGVLVMTNRAYTELWGGEAATPGEGAVAADALRLWKSLAHPSPHWATLRARIGAAGDRVPWDGAIELRDGRHLACRLVPLAGGATLVGFRPAATGAAQSAVAVAPAPDAPAAGSAAAGL